MPIPDGCSPDLLQPPGMDVVSSSFESSATDVLLSPLPALVSHRLAPRPPNSHRNQFDEYMQGLQHSVSAYATFRHSFLLSRCVIEDAALPAQEPQQERQ